MRNIIIILSLVLFTSCEYDYIHENPKHPQEYLGNWICDSTYLNGVKNNKVVKCDFRIMQTGVDITSTVNIYKYDHYADWEVDLQQTTLTLLNSNYISILSYEIVRKPYKLALKDTTNNITYYLHH